MAVFKYELRQIRGLTIAWAAAMAVTIFAMLPTYIGFMTSDAVPLEMLTGNDFFEMMGIAMQNLTTPIGVYGFLTSFCLLAGAINGIHLGLKTFTKEYVQKTADYLMTKPHSRMKIYFAKVLAGACAALIISAAYLAGSVLTVTANGFDIPMRAFWPIALSFLWMQLFGLGLGALAGTAMPRIRTPLLVSSGAAFVLYILGSFSRKTGNEVAKFLTPFTYFDSGHIIETGWYPARFMAAYVLLLAAFLIIGLVVYRKKDVPVAS